MSEDELKKMIESDYWQVRNLAAQNPKMTPELLEFALNDSDWIVRYSAAQNLNMTLELIEIALKHEDQNVRHSAYHHKNITNDMKILYRLSHTEDEDFWRNPYDGK